MNRKRRNKTGFSWDPASVFGKCVRDCDRAGERAESAVCNGGMPDGWRYRPCAVRKTRDRSYGNGEHNEIMTCILALENGQEQTVATASAKAAAAPKVHLGVREGEQFLLGDLLYSLMLESHNDAAVMIAETIGGSVEEFASLMNEKPQQSAVQIRIL